MRKADKFIVDRASNKIDEINRELDMIKESKKGAFFKNGFNKVIYSPQRMNLAGFFPKKGVHDMVETKVGKWSLNKKEEIKCQT